MTVSTLPAQTERFTGTFPASVSLSSDVTEMMKVIRENHVLDPEILTERPPVFFRAEISNNRIDAYYTRMHPTTLANYAREAQDGVSLQNSHVSSSLSLGRSLSGIIETIPNGLTDPGAEGDLVRVFADFYTIPGLRLNEVDTDNFILGLRSGIIHDVSVGFYGGEYRCSICARDMMWDWDCTHVPGVKYSAIDGDGNEVPSRMAIAWIVDAHLAEVSAVYDGATPGCSVQKAQMEAARGRLRENVARMIERRYRIKLPTHERNLVAVASVASVTPEEAKLMVIPEPITDDVDDNPTNVNPRAVETPDPPAPAPQPNPNPEPLEEGNQSTPEDDQAQQLEGTRSTPKEERHMPDENREQTPESRATVTVDIGTMPLPTEVRSMLEKHSVPCGDNVLDTLRMVTDECVRLRPLADDGKKYKAACIDRAITEGVRCFGTDFKEERQRALFDKMDIEEVEQMRETWEDAAKVKLQGGRSTVSESETDGKTPPARDRSTRNDRLYVG